MAEEAHFHNYSTISLDFHEFSLAVKVILSTQKVQISADWDSQWKDVPWASPTNTVLSLSALRSTSRG